MRFMKILIGLPLICVFHASSAVAADWSGLYIGVNQATKTVTGDWTTTETRDEFGFQTEPSSDPEAMFESEANGDALRIGLIGNPGNWVFGLEAFEEDFVVRVAKFPEYFPQTLFHLATPTLISSNAFSTTVRAHSLSWSPSPSRVRSTTKRRKRLRRSALAKPGLARMRSSCARTASTSGGGAGMGPVSVEPDVRTG